MTPTDIVSMKVSQLSFDIGNPRLPEFDLTCTSSDAEIVQVLWDAMDVRELAMSIAASGFFPHEPLIVARENGKNVVIEGNRRLAAVTLLLNPALASDIGATNLPHIEKAEKEKLRQLPVMISTRKEAWRFLGFKHVNGPAKWSSYAKARYIADVHRKHGIGLAEIGRQIGDTHKTVQRLYRALMVIEQAEDMKLFRRDDRWKRHFSFSHLYTGIDYDGIESFIGLRAMGEENQEPVPHEKKQELRDLCIWMYGSKREDKQPVISSQNPDLRYLDAVVSNKESLAALRAGSSLSDAHEISRPSSSVFEESLMAAKRNLERAQSKLSSGYRNSEGLLRIAGTIVRIAEDLYDDMERKHRPKNKKKRLTTVD